MKDEKTGKTAEAINKEYEELNEKAIDALKKITEENGGFINLTKGFWTYTYSYDNCYNEAQEVRLTAIELKDGELTAYTDTLNSGIETEEDGSMKDEEIREYCEKGGLGGGWLLVTQTLKNIFERLEQENKED